MQKKDKMNELGEDTKHKTRGRTVLEMKSFFLGVMGMKIKSSTLQVAYNNVSGWVSARLELND